MGSVSISLGTPHFLTTPLASAASSVPSMFLPFYQLPLFDIFGYARAMKTINHRSLWSRIMVILGSIGILAGALDPMEGSVVILIGSGLVALGTFLGQGERRLIRYRTWTFILIAVGVGAMFGLSNVGGFGGKSGLSMWWGVLILPYLIGWSMSVWGPGNPRWFWSLGIVVGLWYLVLGGIVLSRPSQAGGTVALVIILGAIGLMTIGGCITRLVIAIRNPQLPKTPATSAA